MLLKYFSDGQINYFVVGAGAMVDYLGNTQSGAELIWSGTGYSAFASASVTRESFTVSYVNIYGT